MSRPKPAVTTIYRAPTAVQTAAKVAADVAVTAAIAVVVVPVVASTAAVVGIYGAVSLHASDSPKRR